jgi:hypothetical protein
MRHKLNVPKNLPPKPGPKKAGKKPVSYLLGPRLNASLKLTAFVMAVDKPDSIGKKLEPRIVDVFRINP